MAAHPASPTSARDETRAVLETLRERNAESRQRVLRRAANLGRIAEKLRNGQRPR